MPRVCRLRLRSAGSSTCGGSPAARPLFGRSPSGTGGSRAGVGDPPMPRPAPTTAERGTTSTGRKDAVDNQAIGCGDIAVRHRDRPPVQPHLRHQLRMGLRGRKIEGQHPAREHRQHLPLHTLEQPVPTAAGRQRPDPETQLGAGNCGQIQRSKACASRLPPRRVAL